MEMTFQQYIDNPLGRKNAAFSQRDAFKRMFTEKFDKVLLREAGKINSTLYVDKSKDRYVAHIKVPSETVKDFYYDAVIMFYTDDPAQHSASNLNGYYVKFFSNDPAFVYTYLYVFLQNDLFFEDLKPKSSKLALTKKPSEKNPFGIPGYSKILYFAFLYMKQKNMFQKYMFKEYAKPYSARELLQHVDHCDEKIAQRQERGAMQAKEESRARREEKHKTATESREKKLNNLSGGNVKVAPKVGMAKTVKRTPMAKTAKVAVKNK